VTKRFHQTLYQKLNQNSYIIENKHKMVATVSNRKLNAKKVPKNVSKKKIQQQNKETIQENVKKSSSKDKKKTVVNQLPNDETNTVQKVPDNVFDEILNSMDTTLDDSPQEVVETTIKEKKKKHDSQCKITKMDIRRVCRRAGVVRMSDTVFNTVRDIMNTELNNIVSTISHLVTNSRRVTVTKEDIINAARFVHGINIACVPKETTENFSTYIYRTLKEMHPNAGLTSNAKDVMNSLVHFVATNLNDTVLNVMNNGNNGKNARVTLQERDVLAACRILFPGELAVSAVEHIKKAIKNFREYKPVPTTNSDDDKRHVHPETSQNKAKIFFSVSRVRNMAKDFGAERLSATFSVAIAAALEYICMEVLELSGNISDRVNITERDIFLAISSDTELNELFLRRMKVLIPNSGVPELKETSLEYKELLQPNRTIQKNNRRRTTTSNLVHDSNTRRHRFLPGTVARRETRKSIKETKLILHHEPFDRLTRTVTQKINPNMRFSRGSVDLIQNYVEHLLISYIQKANHQSLRSGHKTLDGSIILENST